MFPNPPVPDPDVSIPTPHAPTSDTKTPAPPKLPSQRSIKRGRSNLRSFRSNVSFRTRGEDGQREGDNASSNKHYPLYYQDGTQLTISTFSAEKTMQLYKKLVMFPNTAGGKTDESGVPTLPPIHTTTSFVSPRKTAAHDRAVSRSDSHGSQRNDSRMSGATLVDLPQLEEFSLAGAYVHERTEALRMNPALLDQFQFQCREFINEKRERQQQRLGIVNTPRPPSQRLPSPATNRNRSEMAKARRRDDMKQRLGNAQQIVEDAEARREKAASRKVLLMHLSALTRQWAKAVTTVTAFHTMRLLSDSRKYRMIKKFKVWVVFLCAWHWRRIVRTRQSRIDEIKRNLLLRKRIPALIQTFRERRHRANIGLVLKNLRAIAEVKAFPNLVHGFHKHIRQAQRLVRQRIMRRRLWRIMLFAQWDRCIQSTVGGTQMAFPDEVRNAVLNKLIEVSVRKFIKRQWHYAHEKKLHDQVLRQLTQRTSSKGKLSHRKPKAAAKSSSAGSASMPAPPVKPTQRMYTDWESVAQLQAHTKTAILAAAKKSRAENENFSLQQELTAQASDSMNAEVMNAEEEDTLPAATQSYLQQVGSIAPRNSVAVGSMLLELDFVTAFLDSL